MPRSDFIATFFSIHGESLILLEEELQKLRQRLERERDNLIYWTEPSTGRWMAWGAVIERQDIYREILIKHVKNALNSSAEFSQPLYSRGLLEACSQEGIIDLIKFNVTSGTFQVEILMNRFAGTLEDWANAVKKVREQIHKDSKRMGVADANLASYMFYEKYFSVDVYGKGLPPIPYMSKGKIKFREVKTEKYKGKYTATINKRLEASSKLAPWWEILDKGTSNVKLSSDRGGYSSIFTSPTNFVEKARQEIYRVGRELYEDRLASEKKDAQRIAKNVRRRIKELEQIIAEIESYIALNYATPGPKPDVYLVARDRVRKVLQIQELEEKADPEKVEKLIRDLAAGIQPKGGRIRLGGGVRIRTIRIMQQIEAEMRKG